MHWTGTLTKFVLLFLEGEDVVDHFSINQVELTIGPVVMTAELGSLSSQATHLDPIYNSIIIKLILLLFTTCYGIPHHPVGRCFRQFT